MSPVRREDIADLLVLNLILAAIAILIAFGRLLVSPL
jgi:hypothetical protein